ncbi:efflux RND transporter periplasmic adaptor subunit [Aestuariibius sp. HNIBRBA575]|uniref:efflux RND transporter periplasmic adaptor subunit n=1 Tax=Aestuariibius sp. HNIBRBA575 TaxID=3233343 RepID=UPI0034A308C6
MAKAKKRSRAVMTILVVGLIGAALTAAFWPRPTMVDLGEITRAPMMVTIDEEGRTRVHDAYIVSTPVAGRLLRVTGLPGDPVTRGETVVANMRPHNPTVLDVRTREQAQALVAAAQAGLRVAQANLNSAMANNDLAQSDLDRTRQLAGSGTASQAALDRAQSAARAALAAIDTAQAAIAMREAELTNAQAQLIGFDDQGLANALGDGAQDTIALFSPINGTILRVIQQSETILPAGAPVMEIGNVQADLEVVVDLISSDAVQVSVGDRVIVQDWGGPVDLSGVVRRIDPFGVTKYSALGVEKQRVSVVIHLNSDVADRAALGHGFRVEARIVVWENDNTLTIPASALFRHQDGWATFVVEDGIARHTFVSIGKMNGISAQVLDGVMAGQNVVLYPSAGLVDGAKVAQRVVE